MTPESEIPFPVLDFLSGGEEDTHEFGKLLSRSVFPGLLVLLSGDLGTGKTVLVRGIVEGLSGGNVRSPSFTLVNEYKADIPVTHADLYRLSCCRFEDLGLEEALEEKRLVLVEWAQNWKEPPQGETWKCVLERRGARKDGENILIRIQAIGKSAARSLEEVRQALPVE